jgi:hypothetical protein
MIYLICLSLFCLIYYCFYLDWVILIDVLVIVMLLLFDVVVVVVVVGLADEGPVVQEY